MLEQLRWLARLLIFLPVVAAAIVGGGVSRKDLPSTGGACAMRQDAAHALWVDVHVLNGIHRTPIAGAEIEVAGGHVDPAIPGWFQVNQAYVPALRLVTDSRGESRIALLNDTDPGIIIKYDTNHFTGCSQLAFCVRDVISTGVAPDDFCWKQPKGSVPPRVETKPGDIYVFLESNGFLGNLDFILHGGNGPRPGDYPICQAALAAKPRDGD